MNIRVYPPDGNVIVSIPLKMPLADARQWIDSKQPWIEKQRAKILSRIYAPQLHYSTGETHTILGQEYTLTVVERTGRAAVKVNIDNNLWMYAPLNSTRDDRQKILELWIRRQMKATIQTLITTWSSPMGVEVREFGIKSMRTKWGTCNTRDRRIWLNLELASMSLECLEYVVVHEMVHLLERGHTARFWRLMDTFLPRWREYRDELRTKPRPYVPR